MSAALTLLTPDDLAPLQATLNALLALATKAAAPGRIDELLSIQQVSKNTGFDPRTVDKWRTHGRYNAQGKKVYLPAYEFSGFLRFNWADVVAFGQGVGVLEPSQVGEARPEPAKKASAKPKTKKPMASEDALRKVA